MFIILGLNNILNNIWKNAFFAKIQKFRKVTKLKRVSA